MGFRSRHVARERGRRPSSARPDRCRPWCSPDRGLVDLRTARVSRRADHPAGELHRVRGRPRTEHLLLRGRSRGSRRLTFPRIDRRRVTEDVRRRPDLQDRMDASVPELSVCQTNVPGSRSPTSPQRRRQRPRPAPHGCRSSFRFVAPGPVPCAEGEPGARRRTQSGTRRPGRQPLRRAAPVERFDAGAPRNAECSRERAERQPIRTSVTPPSRRVESRSRGLKRTYRCGSRC